jgi:MFS family permease
MSLPAPSPSAERTSVSVDTALSTETRSHSQPSHAPRRSPRFLGTLVEPLRYRDFRLLFSGQLISIIGDNFYAVALPWLILQSGGSVQDLGIVLMAYGIPRVGTLLAGGWLSDRLHPRRVMLTADAARVLLVGALALLALWSHPSLWQLCAIVAPLGLFAGLFVPASWAITPEVLPDDVLPAGNSLSIAWSQLANLVGPGLAGLLVSQFASGIALVVDAFSFLVSAGTLAAMRSGRKHVVLDSSVVADSREGPLPADEATQSGGTTGRRLMQGEVGFWRFLRGSRLFQLVLFISIMLNLVYGGILEVGLPALAHGPLRAGANGYGIMLTAFGAGALVGGISGGFLTRLPHPWLANLSIWAAQGLAVVAIPLTGTLMGATIALGMMGLCNGLGNVSFFTLVQQALPRHLLGRFMGAMAFANFGLFPISVAIAAVLMTAVGPGLIISASGALTILPIVVALIPSDIRRLA